MNLRDFLRISTKGAIWIVLAVIAQSLIGFVIQVALARILVPEVFGQIAFATTVALFFNAFTNLRGDAYVIQQSGSPEHAVDVVFTIELTIAIFFVTLVFVISPSIMDFLGKSNLTKYVQLLACSFFYNPFCRTRCLLERDLSFFSSKYPLIIGQLIAGASSIALAKCGYGVWSLVWWRLSVMFFEVCILWVIAPYRPKLKWDYLSAKRFFGFSWPLLISGILSFFCYNVDYFVVGQFLKDGTIQLGYYWLGFQAATYFLMARQVLYNVLFPIFSRLDNEEFKKRSFLRLARATAGIFVLLTTLAVIFGRDFIKIIYGNKWGPAVFPFQIIFIVVMMRAVNANMGYYLYSLGQTLPELTSVLMSAILLAPTVYFSTIYYGINGAAVAVLVVEIMVSSIIYRWYIKPITNCGVLHFFLRPWTISGFALMFALVAQYFDFSFVVKIIMFFILIAMAYILILRDVMNDLKAALLIMKPTPSKA